MLKSFLAKIMPIKYDLVSLKPSDAKIIKQLFIEGVETGSYTKNLLRDKNNFHQMIDHMVNNKLAYDSYGRSAVSFGCKYQNKIIGFITLAIDDANNEIEIWYFSLLEEHRNRGLGEIYTNLLFEIIRIKFCNVSLIARCHSSHSIVMQKILLKNGFITGETNQQGFITLSRNKL